jgi:predicted glutamine amidotransferase
MCRFIVYHGPPITMSTLVTEPEHAMLQLSMKAFCCATPINADGFGLSWYIPDIPVPGAYKDVTPAWNNANLKLITRAVRSNCFFAHVRAASAGGVNYPNCHPFTYKNLSFMHNGTVPYFKQIKRSMIMRISERAFQLVQGTTDSEMVFALFVTNLEKIAALTTEGRNTYHQEKNDGIEDEYEYIREKLDITQYLVAALKDTLRQVHYLVLQHEIKTHIQELAGDFQEFEVDGASMASPLPPTRAIGRLNLAVTDGQSTCVSRYVTSRPDTAHSLYYSTGSKFDSDQCQVILSSSTGSLSLPLPVENGVTPGIIPPSSPLLCPSMTKRERVVVVSSEPLAKGFNCAEVPVNHMVVSGPSAFFSVEPC